MNNIFKIYLNIRILIYLTIIYLFQIAPLFGQINYENSSFTGNDYIINKIIDFEPDADITVIEWKDGKIEIDKENLSEEIDIIVEFKEDPYFMAQQKASLKKLTISSYLSTFNKFDMDLNRGHKMVCKRYNSQFKYPTIEHKFYRVFNGISLRVTKAHLKFIQELNYVKRIHKNKKMEKYLDKSVSLIRADSLIKVFNTKGEGVVVGVIDTGIDYNHPALGSGYGAGYKVIDGYDFINDDSDPMDDNGHGTHVAGIIAADSDSIQGVAPGVQLMAFKVLDSNGGGDESDIIAGIERALDPNQDGNKSDRVDIVNMSLGSYNGNPDDAVSTAVDNGVKCGTTFCISAGNSGHIMGFNSIGSPGTSRLAITVGASDEFDKIAPFSSKGPNKKNYCIKPDVLAPGVNINSLSLDGFYREASGTSMAAPHVTGVCALLKSIHPVWKPSDLKSALMTTAVDIGEEIMIQGAGRIDAFNAASVKTIICPSQLSFGLDQVDYATWEVQDTLIFKNIDSTVQNYNLEIKNINMGVTFTTYPSLFSLSFDDSQSVIVKMSVNNNAIPYPLEGSLTFDSELIINTDTNKLHMPIAFVKASKLIINFDKPNPDIFISSESFSYHNIFWNWDDLYSAEVIIPKGNYDLFFKSEGWQSKYFIFKENYQIEGFESLNIQFKDAKNLIDLKGIDENNSLLSQKTNSKCNHLIVFPELSKYRSIRMAHPHDTVYVSDFSERFSILTSEIQYDFDTNNHIYVLQHEPINGLGDSIVLQNGPEDFKIQYVKLNLDHVKDPFIYFYNTRRYVIPGYSYTVEFGMQDFEISKKEWQGKLFLTPSKHENYQFVTSLVLCEKDHSSKNRIIHTKPFVLKNDSIGCYFSYNPTPDVILFPINSEMEFGLSPISTDVFTVNNIYGENNLAIFPDFYGPLGEKRYKDFYTSVFTLSDADQNEILSDSLFKMEPINLKSSRYKLQFSHSNYYIKDTQGAAKLVTEFDLGNDDPDPPRITSFKLLNSENIPSDHFDVGESANLYFSVSDYKMIVDDYVTKWEYKPVLVDSTQIFYKYHNLDNWCRLMLNPILEDSSIGILYSSNVSELTINDSTAIDLKIITYDQTMNSIKWTVEPAFSVGNYVGVTHIENSEEKMTNLGSFSLKNNYPNPFNSSTIIKFEIPFFIKINIKIYDILGRPIRNLVDKEFKPGEYSLSWSGTNDSGIPVSSGIYFYRMETSDFCIQKKMLLVR